jgi:DNA-binding winged helix-turn-helix (wHTH) protein
MLQLRDLAVRPDFQAGPIRVSPSRRLVEGPAGKTHLAPLIMQVFLLLLDRDGQVVTRNELFDQCWGGVMVGDDSLNRAVAKVRRIAAAVAPGLFEIETIPRTGYRLTGPILDDRIGRTGSAAVATDGERAQLSRRVLIGGGAAAAAVLGAGAAWWRIGGGDSSQFETLMARGDEAFRNGSAFEDDAIGPNNRPAMIRLYQEAVRIRPDNARAWGLLAYFQSAAADAASSTDSPRIVADAQTAIHRAFDIDPKEPNARVAMFRLQGPMFDWAARDRQLRSILATDPNNIPAMMELMPLLQAVGLTRESWSWNERILKLSPFLRACLVVRAMKLWIMGRNRQADEVITRVLGLWPDDRFANYARFNILALTGRPGAARAILDGRHGLRAEELRRVVVDALEFRTPAAIKTAEARCLEAARASPPLANDVVMYLCALGLADTAFELTEGFLLWRGKMISKDAANGKEVDDYSRRMTQWLFTPPVAIMRSDPRFQQLCDEFGLTAYWHARGVRPDYQVYG